MIDILEDLRALTSKFDEQKIDYALCGGMAMAIHQKPRMTIDIDLLIPPECLTKALFIATELGYTIRGKDLSFAGGAIEIRRVSKIDPEAGDLLSLDFLLVTPQLLNIWQDRTESEWEGGKLKVVSREGLIALKQFRLSGQDRDDIQALLEGEPDVKS